MPSDVGDIATGARDAGNAIFMAIGMAPAAKIRRVRLPGANR